MNGLVAIGLVFLVAALAWWLRRSSVTAPGIPQGPIAEADSEPDLEAEDEESEVELAITSDGDLFIPDGYSVRVVSLDPQEMQAHREDIEAGVFATTLREARGARQGKPGSALSVGDLTAIRLRRGAADVVPWLLETLGRDGEYIPFAFETEEGARAALNLLERYRIVRRPLDEDGNPIPASTEDFEEAKRRYNESWQALAMEQEPGQEPGPPYSDRR